MILRRMTVEDIPQVRCIEVNTSETPWSYQTFVDCVEVGYQCWVLEDPENKLVSGFGLLSYGAAEGHILNIAIDNYWQGKGHGERMMKHLLSVAKEAGNKSVYLEVRRSNEKALKLYEKLKFIEIGKRVDYYGTKDGSREDAIVLEISLEN